MSNKQTHHGYFKKALSLVFLLLLLSPIEASSLSSFIIKKPLIKSMQFNQPVQLIINYNAIKGNQDHDQQIGVFINNKKILELAAGEQKIIKFIKTNYKMQAIGENGRITGPSLTNAGVSVWDIAPLIKEKRDPQQDIQITL